MIEGPRASRTLRGCLFSFYSLFGALEADVAVLLVRNAFNDRWRIRFEWPTEALGPANVEIVDYH